jgi:hypothetical protein
MKRLWILLCRTMLLPVCCLVVAGCSASPQEPSAQAPKQGEPSPSATDPSGKDGALAAYRAMWADMEAAGVTADTNSPRLHDHASGAALRLLKFGLSKERNKGVVVKGKLILSPEVISATPSRHPDRVEISDCSDSTHWLLYKPDGDLQNNVPGGHYVTTATAQLNDGQWMVTQLHLGEIGSC